MKNLVVTAAFLLSCGTSLCAGQSANSSSQNTSDAAKPVAQPSSSSAQTPTDQAKTKPKKVWTNEEIAGVGGDGAISVVGKAGSGDSNPSSNNSQKNAAVLSARYKQAAPYRDRLRQLNNQLETIDKKISELQNFKADNSSPSGGINMHQRYDRTPINEQIKELEEKQKQIKAQIEAVEDQARKNGFEAGQLR
jgi:vacuolar-type H+-ATPase subunit I/STV1